VKTTSIERYFDYLVAPDIRHAHILPNFAHFYREPVETILKNCFRSHWLQCITYILYVL